MNKYHYCSYHMNYMVYDICHRVICHSRTNATYFDDFNKYPCRYQQILEQKEIWYDPFSFQKKATCKKLMNSSEQFAKYSQNVSIYEECDSKIYTLRLRRKYNIQRPTFSIQQSEGYMRRQRQKQSKDLPSPLKKQNLKKSQNKKIIYTKTQKCVHKTIQIPIYLPH